MSATLNYLRLYADEAGVSHFAPLEIEVFQQDFAPPTLPFAAAHVGLRAVRANGVRGR
jgi:hypothetical protein